MDLYYRTQFGWSGWADADGYQAGHAPGTWGYTGGPGSEPWQECYDDIQQYWAIDLRSVANPYPDFNLESVIVETWSRKKKHSEEHIVKIADYFAGSWADNPASQPYNQLVPARPLAPEQHVWTSKNSVTSRTTTHNLYRAIPLSTFQRSPLFISIRGVPNSRRSYGYAKVVGIRAWRERQMFPGWASNVMRQAERAVPGWGSQLLGGGHWLSEYRADREYLGIRWPPVNPDSWTHTGGRGGGIPGTLWGGTRGYATFTPPTKRNVIGVKIEFDVKKKQGSHHGHYARWLCSAINNPDAMDYNYEYYYNDNGPNPHTVILKADRVIGAGQPIYVQGRKNGDRGDGTTFNYVRITDIYYQGDPEPVWWQRN